MTNFANATQTNPAGIARAMVRKYEARDPTTADYIGYTLGDIWENHLTNTWWILISLTSYLAIWVKFAVPTGWLTSLTGNSGGAVFGDSNQNINTLGDTTTINVVGNPATNTLTWSTGPTVATSYPCNVGTAIPALGVLNVLGAGSVTTTGAGNTITITSSGLSQWLDEAVSFLSVINTGYFCTAALTAILPAAPVQGDQVAIYVDTAGTVVIQANAGQTIRFNQNTSSVAGTATNSARGDLLWFVYRAVGNVWQTINHVGLWSLA